MRFVAEVADEPLHVGDGHAEGGAGLRNHVFLDHDAAEIVRAEFQRDLPDLQTLRDPGTLDVLKIIQVNAAQRLRAQVFMRADGGRFQLGMLGLKRPADEGGEVGRRTAGSGNRGSFRWFAFRFSL